ncbi:MAG: acetylxylan esterase [Planctomycetes bacterium]|nr:acetylxylan esterase [Planctomycetota bacterium]
MPEEKTTPNGKKLVYLRGKTPAPHKFETDPTFGYSADELLTVTAPKAPPDFDEFWQQTYAENMAVPVDYEIKEVESWIPGYKISEIYYRSWNNFRTGGYLVVPEEGEINTTVVFGHGYPRPGIERINPELDLPLKNAAILFVHGRGFGLSPHPECPHNDSMLHFTVGIKSKETRIIRGCVAQLWGAASVMLDIYPQTEGNLIYAGGSFGGALGALMLPWEKRYTKAYLNVPAFGNYPLAKTFEGSISAEWLRKSYERIPNLAEILSYYDTAIAASRITCPVVCSPALADPKVPPPTQFAVANALNRESELYVLPAGHYEYEGIAVVKAKLNKYLDEFFNG